MYTPIASTYYVYTKDLGRGPQLLGRLDYNNGSPVFTYAENPMYQIGSLSVRETVHKGAPVLSNILTAFAPPTNSTAHDLLCRQVGIQSPCINSWELMEGNWEYHARHQINGSYPLCDGPGTMMLYREVL